MATATRRHSLHLEAIFDVFERSVQQKLSHLPLRRRLWPSARLITLLTIFVLVTVSRALFVGLYAESIPFWDQWDSEGAALIKPWIEGTLSFEQLFNPHNEHRIAWSRAVFLALFEANGRQWDNLVTVYANTAVYAGVHVLLFAQLTKDLTDRLRLVLIAAAVVVLACIPLGWENTLVGFQNQFYFMIGFAAATLALAARGPDEWRTIAALVVLSTAGLFTMASGLLAPMAGAGVLMLRSWQGTLRRPLAAVGAVALMVIGLVAYSQVPALEHHRFLKAADFHSWSRALWVALSWPLPFGRFAPLVIWLPMICCVARPRRLKEASRSDLVALGLGTWTFLQAAAMAYSRGQGMVAPPSRYQDILVVGVIANLWFAICEFDLALARASRSAYFSIFVCASFPLGVCYGLVRRLPEDLAEARTRQYLSIQQTENVRAFVLDGNATHLNAPHLHIPYPDPVRLAGLLSDSTLRKTLPSTVRAPLKIEGSGAGFLGNEHTNSRHFVNSCGAVHCSVGTGKWQTNLQSTDFDFVRIPVFTSQRQNGLELGVCPASSPSRCSHEGVSGAFVFLRAPRESFKIAVTDDSSKNWIVIGAPVEINWLSLASRRLRAWAVRHVPHEPLAAAPRSGHIVELPYGAPDGNLPLALAEAQDVKVEVQPKQGGHLLGISVLVGTYGGRSNGFLHVELCQMSKCIKARAGIREATDNDFIHLPLSEPVGVEEGGPIVLRFFSTKSRRPVALWSYPTAEGAPRILGDSRIPDLQQNRSLRIRLHFL